MGSWTDQFGLSERSGWRRLELYYDRPEAEWFDAEGRPVLKNEPCDLAAETAAAALTSGVA
jgi:hypothetical protein